MTVKGVDQPRLVCATAKVGFLVKRPVHVRMKKFSPGGGIVANMKHASTYSPVAFRSVHTGIEQPFLLKIYYAITACMTQGFTFRKY